MVKNYIKIAFRSMLWNKVSTIVNVVGLSISMVIGVFIFAFIKSHWETDHFHPFVNKTFRITTQIQDGNRKSLWATSPQPLSGMLTKLSFINKITTVRLGGSTKIAAQKKEISVEVIFAEPSFFDIFGFKLLKGNAKKLLTDPNSVLISQEIAKRLFGEVDPEGELLKLDGWGTYQVAGVIKKPAFRTHIPVEVMLSLDGCYCFGKKSFNSEIFPGLEKL